MINSGPAGHHFEVFEPTGKTKNQKEKRWKGKTVGKGVGREGTKTSTSGRTGRYPTRDKARHLSEGRTDESPPVGLLGR